MRNEVIIKDAVKRYDDFTALNGVSLDIHEGEFFTLLLRRPTSFRSGTI